MIECEKIRNFNKLFFKNQYNHLIHNDKFNNFRMINFIKNYNIDYNLYLVANELYKHDELNIFYYYENIYEQKQLFYDEHDPFIIKRKQLFEQLQTFNLGISRLKQFINFKYKKAKNETNLYGEKFKNSHIEIIENGSKYRFDFFEMYNIVDSCFKQICEGVPVILNIKNPYTNENFSYHNIINIYFRLITNGRIPKYFYLYFHNNLSKIEIYNQYHFNLFIDVMKYSFLNLTIKLKIDYIDKMLNYCNYYSFIHKSTTFKIEHLSNIGLKYYLALKIINHYGTDYHDVYFEYIEVCREKLNLLRTSNLLTSTNYSIRSC